MNMSVLETNLETALTACTVGANERKYIRWKSWDDNK